MSKKAEVHLHNATLHGHKKEGKLTLCDSMDGPGEYYVSEISQSWKERHHMISLICEIMNKIN